MSVIRRRKERFARRTIPGERIRGVDVVNLSDEGSSDEGSREDSYVWWDKFSEKSYDYCDGASSSRPVIDVDAEEIHDVEDDEDEYNEEFFIDLNEAELRALRSHHSCAEARVDQDDGKMRCSEIRLGALYVDKKSLQEAIVDYAVKNCFETFVRRSEPTRLFVGCKVKSCRFRINATIVSRKSTF